MSDFDAILENWLRDALPAWCGRNDALEERAVRAFEQRRWDDQRAAARARRDVRENVAQAAAMALRRALSAPPSPDAWRAAARRVTCERDPLRAHTLLAEVAEHMGLPVPVLDVPTTGAPRPARLSGSLDATACDSLLGHLELDVRWRDRDGDARWLAKRFAARFGDGPLELAFHPELFFRNRHAYLVGHAAQGESRQGFTIALVHRDDGVAVDALLCGEHEIVPVFAFSRSYLLVRDGDPRALVSFLAEVMPGKPREQLFINIGHADIGKAMIRATILRAATANGARLVRAPGVPGLVMAVFTAEGLPWVVKVPRDVARPPKRTTPARVFDRYRFVAGRDRAGRIADSHALRGLEVPLAAVAPDLLDELQRESASFVAVERDARGGAVLCIRDALVERRLVPLDVFLREADAGAVRDAVVDYGRAIEDLARTDVFAGDLLPKNFGVGADGRVVFYDFDEVCSLQECRFRRFPDARHDDDEMRAEPWFAVRDEDVFPEEFRTFVAPPGEWGDLFRTRFPHLFEPEFWNGWREFHARGGWLDLRPYASSRFEDDPPVMPG